MYRKIRDRNWTQKRENVLSWAMVQKTKGYRLYDMHARVLHSQDVCSMSHNQKVNIWNLIVSWRKTRLRITYHNEYHNQYHNHYCSDQKGKDNNLIIMENG